MTLRSIPSALIRASMSFLSLPSPAKTKRTSGNRATILGKALEAFNVPLARLEDGKHQDDGGPGIVWPEAKQIAPVFGLGRIAEERQLEAGRHDMVALRCPDACLDAQIPHSRD